MVSVLRRALLLFVLGLVSACAAAPDQGGPDTGIHRGETPELHAMIDEASDTYGVPAPLIHRIIQRESGYNPSARNGPYYGLMQILPGTARTMGYTGPASGLLDARTNLTYGVKYLRGAWVLSRGSYATAEMWYSRGYYYEARRRGLLREAGLR